MAIEAEALDTRLLVEDALDCFEELIDDLSAPASFRDLLKVHLPRSRAQAADRSSAIQLGVLVHRAAGGDPGETARVGAVCAAIYLGADLLDNIADDELPEMWDGWAPAQIQLAAATYLAALPTVALASLETDGRSPATLWRLAREHSAALVAMSGGQHLDLAMDASDGTDVETTMTVAEQKGGAELALFARTAAVLAGASEDRVTDYAEFGFALGVAGQIANDALDIQAAGTSQDLRNGKHTLPVVHALTTLGGEPRERLRNLLAEARESPECHDAVRAALAEAGSLTHTGSVIEDYRRRATRHLARARPEEPAAAGLHAILDELG